MLSFITILTPWAVCSSGLPRAIAQLILKTLINNYDKAVESDSHRLVLSVLRPIVCFVDSSKDCTKLLNRQVRVGSLPCIEDFRL
jgi:hypothetical protein